MISRKDLDDERTLIGVLDVFVEDGWEHSVGYSHHNNPKKVDDLVAREIYEKTFECGANYKIVLDRLLFEPKVDTTSLPEIDTRPKVDDFYYFRLSGAETINGKTLSAVEQNVIGANCYLDALAIIVDTIAILDEKGNKLTKNSNEES